MDEDTAMARLSSMVAAATDPVLDSEDLMKLLDMFPVADVFGTGSGNTVAVALYAGATAYNPGDTVRTAANRFWRAVTPGTSGGVTFPAVIGPASSPPYLYRDGDIVWQDKGGLWVPSWNLNKAAAEGWRWKAGRLSQKFNFASDNQQFSPQQKMANCLSMVAQYDKKSGGTFRVDATADFINATAYLLPGSG
jgi:hypothetical protein